VLIQAIDAQIKSAAAAGDLTVLKAVTTQKDELLTTCVVPNMPALEEPVAQYTKSMRRADGAPVEVYENAIEAYASKVAGRGQDLPTPKQ
jgi:hypothetical protein